MLQQAHEAMAIELDQLNNRVNETQVQLVIRRQANASLVDVNATLGKALYNLTSLDDAGRLMGSYRHSVHPVIQYTMDSDPHSEEKTPHPNTPPSIIILHRARHITPEGRCPSRLP
jgi:hypothetical protein